MGFLSKITNAIKGLVQTAGYGIDYLDGSASNAEYWRAKSHTAFKSAYGYDLADSDARFDVFRHSWTSATLTRLGGGAKAKEQGDQREIDTAANWNTGEAGLRNMAQDLFNNAKGRAIGSGYGWLSTDQQVAQSVKTALGNGTLVTDYLGDSRTELGNWDHSLWFGSALKQGGAGNDTLTGTSAHDWMNGGAGNDTLKGLAGNDALDGGAGNDLLDGGDGNDLLAGSAGNDTIYGGNGVDVVQETGDKGSGADVVDLGAGNDFLAAGNERVAGNDTYIGGAGSDSLIYRLEQKDLLVCVKAANAGGGVDGTVQGSGVGLDAFQGFETLVLGQGNDTVQVAGQAQLAAVRLDGSAGLDTLRLTLGESLSFVGLGKGAWTGIECIDMKTDAAADAVKLDRAHLADLAGSSGRLCVTGGANDTISVVDGGWKSTGTATGAGGVLYDTYADGALSLWVEHDMGRQFAVVPA